MAVLYVVHYSEVALKGQNRPEFVRALRRNISRPLKALGPEIESRDGRLLLTVESGDPAPVLSSVFGVAWFARTDFVAADYDVIKAAVLRAARASEARTFMIRARRSDKSFPISSMQLARELGSAVVEGTSKRVDLSAPELKIHVDVVTEGALVYGERSRGPGGLPVGTSGRSIHLFSGGIDSPVAAWLLMKRGVRPVYLHFYLAPTHEPVLESKILTLVKTLSLWGGTSTLIMVPFADYQVAAADAPGELEPSLFRRFMRMFAERIARPMGAAAISTGDSLAQAASQTLWNIGAFDKGSSLPILRPLLGYDKDEVVGLARRIRTYDASLEEYRDCCAMVTRHPKTRVRAEVVDRYADVLSFGSLVTKSLGSSTVASYLPYRSELRVSPLAEVLARSAERAATGGSNR